ncbi:uncharacterized protein LOC135688816 [Rhopilema esculentum]|uniref:uncharacterized protein LOC135688816 n=1 Tax=Rhopilema esculentum TaxID=499914 RepID=UPI0031D1BBCD
MTIVEDIRKLSSDAQTSFLESFHSTLNHWHPKMTHFSWMGTICRHTIAMCHFNENINRSQKETASGDKCYSVVYPKFKLGEEVVPEVAVPPSYGYVNDIKEVMFSCSEDELQEAYAAFKGKEPELLNRQFPD